MLIERVINNNVVSVLDEGVEKVIMGRGLGFKKKPGDEVDPEKIEKVFEIKDDSDMGKYSDILADIPLEVLLVSDEIIFYAKSNLGNKLNEIINISLADHINGSIKRAQEGIFFNNPFLRDIKKFYPEEYKVGLKGLDLIEERLKIRLPKDEAGFIALHLVNASEGGGDIKDLYEISKIMHDILSIVRYDFNNDFDEEGVYFYRFTTHLKFFARRVVEGSTYADGVDDDLYNLIMKKYAGSFSTAKKIGDYLLETYDYKISKEELTYLTIHIQRVIYKD